MSQSKSETARTNGAKSNGPTTEAGKAKSARNSLKHGLSSKAVVLPGESAADYEQLRDAYVDQFQPANQVEMDLVEVLASSRLRLRRIVNIETHIFVNKQEGLSDSSYYKETQEDPDRATAYVFERCLPLRTGVWRLASGV